ncbi:type II/IV secretion system ATPase subunit, partial [Candidatus Bathyarchaeota archaeon]|nr:type II/IV secretion system ATPase subunit [Candidatus Bathyarchaeota archaeon]
VKKDVKVPYTFKPIIPEYNIVETYWIREPFSKVTIASMPELGGAYGYFISEAELLEEERKATDKLIDILSAELKPPTIEEEVDLRKHVLAEAERMISKYRSTLAIAKESKDKVLYYVERDLLGFGPIHTMVLDTRIEDVSCEGINTPVYVWHRDYEGLPSNLMFLDSKQLDNLIVKLAHIGGKHVSTAFPIVDTMIYGKHRFVATFKREVTPKGSTFTIRKFREKPLSITELVKSHTITARIAAYFWLLLENRMSIIIIGGTGAGKTTLLNGLASLINPSMKICTVEEIAELNLSHENWVQFVSRESYGIGGTASSAIPLFSLVKTTLRYRPDYIVVGEVRGEEAFVLFQALATGHGGMCTLHAEDVDYAVKRLTSPPMNVAEVYIPLMNVVAEVERVHLPKPVSGSLFGRRVREVSEVLSHKEFMKVFNWDPLSDDFSSRLEESILLRKMSLRTGKSFQDLIDEIDRREIVIKWMVEKGIFETEDVAKVISQYYISPEAMYNIASMELATPIRIKIQTPLKTSENTSEEEKGSNIQS